jgi:hypothetical protein
VPRRRLLQGVLGMFTALAAPLAWASFDLGALMAQLAQRKSGEARFTEERYVSSIDTPLRSSGTLSFAAPDRFARRTLLPRPESMEVQGNLLKLERGGRTRQMTLDAIPELAALVDALRGTLNGDATLLQKQFRARVAGSSARWTLTLTPLDARLAAQIRSLEIVGQGPELRSVEMQLNGGDRSLMIIDPPTP